MKAVYLFPNQAWIVLFGDTPTSVNGRIIWNTLKELKWDLTQCGLKLNKNKSVAIAVRN